MGLRTSEHTHSGNLHISVVVPVSIDIWAYDKLCNENFLSTPKTWSMFQECGWVVGWGWEGRHLMICKNYICVYKSKLTVGEVGVLLIYGQVYI